MRLFEITKKTTFEKPKLCLDIEEFKEQAMKLIRFNALTAEDLKLFPLNEFVDMPANGPCVITCEKKIDENQAWAVIYASQACNSKKARESGDFSGHSRHLSLLCGIGAATSHPRTMSSQTVIINDADTDNEAGYDRLMAKLRKHVSNYETTWSFNG